MRRDRNLFEMAACDSISYSLPAGITNYGIAEMVYGNPPGNNGRNKTLSILIMWM